MDSRPTARPVGARHAFTLIETLCAIAAVGLLIALLLPALRDTRHMALRAVTATRVAQHTKAIIAYSGDYDGYFPYFTNPTASYSVVWCAGQAYRIPAFFAAKWEWTKLMAEYQGIGCLDPSFYPVQEADFGPLQPPPVMVYSPTLFTRPEFWNQSTRTGPDQWRAVRFAETRFTSAKGVLVVFHPWDLNDAAIATRFLAGFADAHVSLHDRNDVPAPFPGGEGGWPGSMSSFGEPVAHTADGVRGRDI